MTAGREAGLKVFLFTIIFGGIGFLVLEPIPAAFSAAMVFFALVVALNA